MLLLPEVVKVTHRAALAFKVPQGHGEAQRTGLLAYKEEFREP